MVAAGPMFTGRASCAGERPTTALDCPPRLIHFRRVPRIGLFEETAEGAPTAASASSPPFPPLPTRLARLDRMHNVVTLTVRAQIAQTKAITALEVALGVEAWVGLSAGLFSEFPPNLGLGDVTT